MFEDICIAEKQIEETELDYYTQRYEFAKKIYTNTKHKNSKLLIKGIEKVNDFILLKKTGQATAKNRDEYINELVKLTYMEKTRNGLFTIGLGIEDVKKIYDLEDY